MVKLPTKEAYGSITGHLDRRMNVYGYDVSAVGKAGKYLADGQMAKAKGLGALFQGVAAGAKKLEAGAEKEEKKKRGGGGRGGGRRGSKQDRVGWADYWEDKEGEPTPSVIYETWKRDRKKEYEQFKVDAQPGAEGFREGYYEGVLKPSIKEMLGRIPENQRDRYGYFVREFAWGLEKDAADYEKAQRAKAATEQRKGVLDGIVEDGDPNDVVSLRSIIEEDTSLSEQEKEDLFNERRTQLFENHDKKSGELGAELYTSGAADRLQDSDAKSIRDAVDTLETMITDHEGIHPTSKGKAAAAAAKTLVDDVTERFAEDSADDLKEWALGLNEKKLKKDSVAYHLREEFRKRMPDIVKASRRARLTAERKSGAEFSAASEDLLDGFSEKALAGELSIREVREAQHLLTAGHYDAAMKLAQGGSTLSDPEAAVQWRRLRKAHRAGDVEIDTLKGFVQRQYALGNFSKDDLQAAHGYINSIEKKSVRQAAKAYDDAADDLPAVTDKDEEAREEVEEKMRKSVASQTDTSPPRLQAIGKEYAKRIARTSIEMSSRELPIPGWLERDDLLSDKGPDIVAAEITKLAKIAKDKKLPLAQRRTALRNAGKLIKWRRLLEKLEGKDSK
jgi:hypothetical protein